MVSRAIITAEKGKMNQDDRSSDSNSAEKEKVNQDGQSRTIPTTEKDCLFLIKISHATVMHSSLAMYHHCTQRLTPQQL